MRLSQIKNYMRAYTVLHVSSHFILSSLQSIGVLQSFHGVYSSHAPNPPSVHVAYTLAVHIIYKKGVVWLSTITQLAPAQLDRNNRSCSFCLCNRNQWRLVVFKARKDCALGCHWPDCTVSGVWWDKYVKLKLFHGFLVNYKIAGRDNYVNEIVHCTLALYFESWWAACLRLQGLKERKQNQLSNQAYSWFL